MSTTSSTHQPAHLSVLAAIEANAGSRLDREGYNGALTAAAEAINAPGVQRIALANGLVEAAEGPLVLAPPDRELWVEFSGRTELLSMIDGATAGALVRPITTGLFADGCSVDFFGSTTQAILPLPGRVVISRAIDDVRAASGVPTAADATASELEAIDTHVSRFIRGDLWLRCAPDADADTIALGPFATDGWRTWQGPDLRSALAATGVISDPHGGLLAADRPKSIRQAALPFLPLMLAYGPRAALRILATIGRRLM